MFSSYICIGAHIVSKYKCPQNINEIGNKIIIIYYTNSMREQ